MIRHLKLMCHAIRPVGNVPLDTCNSDDRHIVLCACVAYSDISPWYMLILVDLVVIHFHINYVWFVVTPRYLYHTWKRCER